MDNEEPSYHIVKDIKLIFENKDKPTFSLQQDYTENAQAADTSTSRKKSDESLSHSKQVDDGLYSWKELLFFSRNGDKRLEEGVLFFNSHEENVSYEDFIEVRKKLKVCIRHKLSKRRNLSMKKKFNKRKFNKPALKKK